MSPWWCGKKALMRMTKTGMRAEQDMNGMMSMVTRRLFGLSMVRVAMTAGTLHPKPMTIGMKDFPCSPMRCMRLSMMKAARAM